MRRLWNWLFPRPNLVRPFAGLWSGLVAVVEEFRPDLLVEFKSLGHEPPSTVALWLDKHFPRDDTRWGLTPLTTAPDNLRHYLENAK